ncbi:CDP-diacylglycerol--serine O-phosphatidyltransferase [Roseovarius gahaiensis]|uniref:CDP-diacylglycerol--serine O-phosphatidyltransferase n=1 Tax=Roseovarius gahaiensis TaxID=2716691 RepID=A0A967EF50_9RHOB|nr:CDP-diacylglycerol--serine O-phosphatidyltransferase [Roseovarius gahaiensis]NHQ73145.1 CDP-diacylglycerol--serine O-phosphatidyltransferase [Roseovarius gahaiensis]
MIHPPGKSLTDMTFVRLLPNIMTLAAICAGLTAIRFAMQENYVGAVYLIILAAVLDGLDGRVARLVGSDSDFGAELDSLADFLNFGVAPALVLYFWGLQGMGSFGWSTVLAFALCCVLRLARFNVSARNPDTCASGAHFTGVPAPAGALLALAPMYLAFAFTDRPYIPGVLLCVYLLFIGLLMTSRIPTPSPKALRFSRDTLPLTIFCVLLVTAALILFEWITLVAMSAIYLAMVVKSLISEFSGEDIDQV